MDDQVEGRPTQWTVHGWFSERAELFRQLTKQTLNPAG